MSLWSKLSGRTSQVERATNACQRLGVPVPSFKPHKRNPIEAVNPTRRARRAIRKHYQLHSGRAWNRFRRWVLR